MSTAMISHGSIANQIHLLGNRFRESGTVEATPIVFVLHEGGAVGARLKALAPTEGWRLETFASANEFLAHSRAVVPHCLVLDVSLSGLNGLELQKRLTIERPNMPIIFVADKVDVPTTVKAMKAGAVELFTRPFAEDLILDAIHEALHRSRVAITHETEMRALRDRYALLTNRERQVMGLVVDGLLNKQVGGQLGISEITVKAHRGQVMHKMKASSFADLVKKADRLGVAS